MVITKITIQLFSKNITVQTLIILQSLIQTLLPTHFTAQTWWYGAPWG